MYGFDDRDGIHLQGIGYREELHQINPSSPALYGGNDGLISAELGPQLGLGEP